MAEKPPRKQTPKTEKGVRSAQHRPTRKSVEELAAQATPGRATRSTAKSRGGKRRPPKEGGQRGTAPEITARNVEIVRMREADHKSWREIAEHFGIDRVTAMRGYDAGEEANQAQRSIEE
ncbi:MAG: hypothetical protein ACREFI_01120, partial [Stellaceae bacterium]